jgi:hypothetical protein
MKNSEKIIEALEKKHPGSKLVYVHPFPDVLDSLDDKEVDDFVKEIEVAEPLDPYEVFK